MSINLYDIAYNLKTVMISEVSVLVGDDQASNVGIGLKGWAEALEYSRREGLSHHASIIFMGANPPVEQPFGRMIINYDLMLSVLTEWDSTSLTLDQDYMELLTEIVEAIAGNRTSIMPSGAIRITNILPLEGTVDMESITYVPIVIVLQIKEQY